MNVMEYEFSSEEEESEDYENFRSNEENSESEIPSYSQRESTVRSNDIALGFDEEDDSNESHSVEDIDELRRKKERLSISKRSTRKSRSKYFIIFG